MKINLLLFSVLIFNAAFSSQGPMKKLSASKPIAIRGSEGRRNSGEVADILDAVFQANKNNLSKKERKKIEKDIARLRRSYLTPKQKEDSLGKINCLSDEMSLGSPCPYSY